MVLLDAAFPDELALERLFPKDERLTHDEWKDMEEQIDELGAYQDAYALIGNKRRHPGDVPARDAVGPLDGASCL